MVRGGGEVRRPSAVHLDRAPTSTGRRGATFRTEIEIDGVTARVMVEQLTVVDPQIDLGDFAGRLDPAELRDVDAALLAVLGLD